MYDLYMLYINTNISNIEKKIVDQRILVNNHLQQVSNIKIHVESYVNYNTLINGKIEVIPLEYKNAVGNYNFYNIIIRNYYSLYNILLGYEDELNQLKAQAISFNVYKTLITRYNKKIMTYCIKTGRGFGNKYFGDIQLFYRDAKGVTNKINWKLSNQNKKAIIERGGEPYLEKKAKEAEEQGLPYNGEKWIVMGFEQGLLYWRWYPSTMIKEEIGREVYNYKYIPARGKFGAVKMLSDIYLKDSHDYTIYAT